MNLRGDPTPGDAKTFVQSKYQSQKFRRGKLHFTKQKFLKCKDQKTLRNKIKTFRDLINNKITKINNNKRIKEGLGI